MSKNESGIFIVFVGVIIGWSLFGPGGWVVGLILAIIGVAVGAAMVLARQRRGPS